MRGTLCTSIVITLLLSASGHAQVINGESTADSAYAPPPPPRWSPPSEPPGGFKDDDGRAGRSPKLPIEGRATDGR